MKNVEPYLSNLGPEALLIGRCPLCGGETRSWDRGWGCWVPVDETILDISDRERWLLQGGRCNDGSTSQDHVGFDVCTVCETCFT